MICCFGWLFVIWPLSCTFHLAFACAIRKRRGTSLDWPFFLLLRRNRRHRRCLFRSSETVWPTDGFWYDCCALELMEAPPTLPLPLILVSGGKVGDDDKSTQSLEDVVGVGYIIGWGGVTGPLADEKGSINDVTISPIIKLRKDTEFFTLISKYA